MNTRKYRNKRNSFITAICLFLIGGFCFIPFADSGVPPLLQRPPEGEEKQKNIMAEVLAITPAENINNEGEPDQKGMIEGDEALSFIIQKLGIQNYKVVYKNTQEFPVDKMSELQYQINDRLNYYVSPKEIANEGVFTLDTRIQIDEGDKKTDAIKAIAKAKLGEPLVYKGIQLANDNYIIVFTLKSEDENNSSGGEQKQENQDKQQQNEEQQNQENEKQNNQEEQKNDQKNKKENRQIELLLESLDDMDQKEQKEMLNERERIMLPDKWW